LYSPHLDAVHEAVAALVAVVGADAVGADTSDVGARVLVALVAAVVLVVVAVVFPAATNRQGRNPTQ
jgi:hypothetical protein